MDTEMTYQEFKKEARSVFPTITVKTLKEIYGLEYGDTIADTPPPQPTCCVGIPNQEGTNPMFDECTVACAAPRKSKFTTAVANAQVVSAVPVEATQRDHTIARLKAIGEKHLETLRKQFHMDGERPKTAAELIDAIKNDRYTLDMGVLKAHGDDIKRGYFNNEFGINWGLPPDIDGYNAAREVLKTTAQKAVDKATLGAVDKLEGVIDDFEAWVYTPAK